MKDGKRRKLPQFVTHPSASQNEWVAHFSCMLQYAEERVGKADAREVATEALWNAYRSKRERPATNEPAAICEWLMYFVYWRSRTFQTRKSNDKKNAILLAEARPVLLDDHVRSHSDAVHSRLTLAKALEVLSPEERELLCATYLLEYSSGEVADTRGVKKRTLQRRLAALVKNVRQQLRDARQGITILLPARDIRADLREFFGATSRTLIRTSHTMQHIGWCSMSVMMGGLVSGGTPATLPTEMPRMAKWTVVDAIVQSTVSVGTTDEHLVLQPLIPLPVAIENEIVEKNHSVPTTRVADAAKSLLIVPDDGAPKEKPSTDSDVFPGAVDVGASAVVPTPIVIPPALKAPTSRPTSSVPSDQACFNAFLDAQTVMNRQQDAASCLAHLNQKPSGMECPETEYRQNLRKRCTEAR